MTLCFMSNFQSSLHMEIPTLISNLYCYRLEIRFYAEENLQMKHWFGAVLRNGFLSMSAEISDPDGVSLWEHIQTFSLPIHHPYYQQLKGGFPKGFFFDCSSMNLDGKGFFLKKQCVQQITLCLIADFSKHFSLFIKALVRFFKRGLGSPLVPLHILDIAEVGINGNRNLLYSDTIPVEGILCNPIRWEDMLSMCYAHSSSVYISFETPVCLYRPKPKQKGKGYQDKLNGFPSFYQLIRSAVYRLATLSMLYTEVDIVDKKDWEEWIESYIYQSSEAFLVQAQLAYCKLYSTPKKEESSVYVLNGYKGQMEYTNVRADYFAILKFASYMNVGNDINYGLGTFRIEMK